MRTSSWRAVSSLNQPAFPESTASRCSPIKNFPGLVHEALQLMRLASLCARCRHQALLVSDLPACLVAAAGSAPGSSWVKGQDGGVLPALDMNTSRFAHLKALRCSNLIWALKEASPIIITHDQHSLITHQIIIGSLSSSSSSSPLLALPCKPAWSMIPKQAC